MNQQALKELQDLAVQASPDLIDAVGSIPLSQFAIYRLIKSGALPAVKIGRTWKTTKAIAETAFRKAIAPKAVKVINLPTRASEIKAARLRVLGR